MESLSDIFSGADDSADSESASTAKAEATTDVKTAEPAKAEQATAAPSAAKTTDEKLATDDKAKADATETPEQIAERTRNEKGQFVKADEVAALRKGLESERRKRQEAEDRAKALEAKQPEAPKKDLFEDPEGAIKERMAPELARIEQAHNAEIIALYEDRCRDKYPDFDAVMDEIKAEAEDDPALAAQLISQLSGVRNKPEHLYKLVVNRREMKAVGGDLSKYKETVTAEFKTKITTLEAENKALKTQLENIGKVPESLNSQASATRAKVESEAVEHESLGEIFKPRKRRA